ncbi:MAG: hypothetical protein ACRDY7_13105 [Acidimicrobiia bacterium]
MSSAPDGLSPWAALRWLRLRWDRAAETALLVLSGAVLIATWRSVSRTPFVADQLSYLASGGVGGLFLLAVGLRLRITGDLRDEWHKLDRIEAALREAADGATSRPAKSHGQGATGGPVVVPAEEDGDAAHREGQRVVSQRGAVAVSAAAAVTLALFAFGWWRAAHAGATSDAFAGFALAAGAGVLLTAELCAPTLLLRRRLGRRKARLLGPFLAVGVARPTAAAAGGSGDEGFVVAPGLTRYHRPGCPAVAGLAVTFSDPGRAAATLDPCELCAAG